MIRYSDKVNNRGVDKSEQAFLGSWKRPFAMFRFFKKTVSQCFFRNAERSEAKIFLMVFTKIYLKTAS